jgi:hypothetical protein
MEAIKLANGLVTPKIDFTDVDKLLVHLKSRARAYRQTFGLNESDIAQNLLIENGLNTSVAQVHPDTLTGLAAGAALLPKRNISTLGKRNASLNRDELATEVHASPTHVIENFIPANTVSLFAGDSGIGKSPFLVQMGIAVAAGIPFLGANTTPGGVLLVDYENGTNTLLRFLDSIAPYMGLAKSPPDFRIYHQAESPEAVQREIMLTKPKLVLIDALRGYDSSMEDKNTEAGKKLNELLHFAEAENVSIVLLHHLRKTSDEYPPGSLEATPIMEWLQQVSGPRALVNQTATRIGVERYMGKSAELILKGHFKGSGEFGPWYIGREYNSIGDPIGYRRIQGTALLSAGHKAAFFALPDTFHFRTAQEHLSKGASSTAMFIRRLYEAGLIVKHGAGPAAHYEKTKGGREE